MRVADGLLDIIALGCVIEFATALNRFRYRGTYDPDAEQTVRVLEQESLCRSLFRVIMKTFGSKYTLNIEGRLTHPAHLWQSILVRFAVVVVGYMKTEERVVKKEPGLTSEKVEKQMRLHLETDHPHLLPAFNAGLKESPPPRELLWDGRPIQIIARPAAMSALLRASGGMEYRDSQDWPLHRDDVILNADSVDAFYEDAWPHEDSDDDL